MWTSLPYLVEAQICFALLWLLYRFFLQRDSCFARSRVYLLMMVPVSLAIPLLSIPVLPAPASLPLAVYTVADTAGSSLPVAAPFAADPAELLWLWVIGAAVMGSVLLVLFYLAHTLRWVRILRGSASSRVLDDVRVVYDPSVKGTCSLFNYIFVNRNDLDERDLNQLMAHELCHVRLRHSWDRLLAVLVTVLCWWNPFVWLWHRSLREIHEYQADDAVLRHGFDAERYITLMMSELTHGGGELASGFSYSLVRRRLQMLARCGSRHGGVRMLLALPVVAVLLTLFSFTERPAASLADGVYAVPDGVIAKAAKGWNYSSSYGVPGSVREALVKVDMNALPDSVVVELDGQVEPRGSKVLDELNPKTVESITVLKPKGEVSRIIITTKAFAAKYPSARSMQMPILIGSGPKAIKIERFSMAPIIVEIDGRIDPRGERALAALDPERIEIASITVLKPMNKIVVTTKARAVKSSPEAAITKGAAPKTSFVTTRKRISGKINDQSAVQVKTGVGSTQEYAAELQTYAERIQAYATQVQTDVQRGQQSTEAAALRKRVADQQTRVSAAREQFFRQRNVVQAEFQRSLNAARSQMQASQQQLRSRFQTQMRKRPGDAEITRRFNSDMQATIKVFEKQMETLRRSMTTDLDAAQQRLEAEVAAAG